MNNQNRAFVLALKAVALALIMFLVIHGQAIGIRAGYSIPTALLSAEMVSYGHITFNTELSGRWFRDVRAELSYPLPATFQSIYTLVIGFSPKYIILSGSIVMTIAGVILYYMISRKILSFIDSQNYSLIFATFSIVFTSWVAIRLTPVFHIGRASLGSLLWSAYILYVFTLLITNYSKKYQILSIILLFASGYTYYTVTLGFLILTIFYIFLFFLLKQRREFFIFHNYKFLLPLLIFASLLVFFNPFIHMLLQKTSLGASSFISNIFDVIKFVQKSIGIEAKETMFETLWWGYGRSDVPLLIYVTSKLFDRLLMIVSIFVAIIVTAKFMHMLMKNEPCKKNAITRENASLCFPTVFFFNVIVFNLAEFSYLMYTSTVPIRFIQRWMPLFLLYVILMYIHIKDFKFLKRFKHMGYIFILSTALFITLLLFLNSIGSYAMFFYHSSHVKPFGIYRSVGITEYLLHDSSVPTKIFGDAWYTGYWAYILHTNSITNIAFETFGKKTFILYQLNQNNTKAIDELNNYKIKTIVINSEGVIYGDTWGYKVYVNPENLSKFLSMYFNRIYNDKFFVLFYNI